MANRVSVLIDVTTDKAIASVKNFRTAVSEAHGVTGKLKAGVSSLGSTFKSAAKNPAVMAGAVAAAGTAALKAVDAFADLGIRVGKFADATGLSAEESSRWVEVADDVGVSTDSLEKTLGKLARSIDPKLFADLGIEIAKTKSGATDINGTFLNVIDRLNGMTDPAKRAEAAQKLLGRGWQDMAELIGQGSTALSKSLAEVSDAKVIDNEEVEKARKYRKTMDELGDVLQDLAISLGDSLLPAIELLAKGLTLVAKAAAPIVSVVDTVVDKIGELDTLDGWFGGPTIGFEDIKDAAEKAGISIEDATAQAVAAGLVSQEWADQQLEAAAALDDTATAADDAESGYVDFGAALEAAKEHAEPLTAALEELTGEIETQLGLIGNYEASMLSFDNTMDDYKKTVEETTAVLTDATATDEAKAKAMRDLRLAQIANGEEALQVAEKYAVEQGAVEGSIQSYDLQRQKLLELKAKYPELALEIDKYLAVLAKIKPNYNTTVTTTFVQKGTPSKPKAGSGSTQWLASGTKSAKRGVAVVGEDGPELLFMNGGEQVMPTDETKRMLNADPPTLAPFTSTTPPDEQDVPADEPPPRDTPTTLPDDMNGGEEVLPTKETKQTFTSNGTPGTPHTTIVNIYPRTLPTETELVRLINNVRRRNGNLI